MHVVSSRRRLLRPGVEKRPEAATRARSGVLRVQGRVAPPGTGPRVVAPVGGGRLIRPQPRSDAVVAQAGASVGYAPGGREPSPPVLIFANQAGGSGKTTAASAMATLLADTGLRVLLVDMDPQRDACHILGYSNPDLLCARCFGEITLDDNGRHVDDCAAAGGGRHEPHPTMFDVVCGSGYSIREAIVPALTGAQEEIPNLHLALASENLSAADVALASMIGADDRLAMALEEVASDYDVILVDCPATLGKLMIAIMVAATHVIACVKPGLKETRALHQLERTMSTVNGTLLRHRPRRLLLGGVLCSDVAAPTHGRIFQDVVERLREEYGDLALPSVARSVRVVQAYARQVPIPRWDPVGEDDRGTARKRAGAVTRDFMSVVAALIRLGVLPAPPRWPTGP